MSKRRDNSPGSRSEGEEHPSPCKMCLGCAGLRTLTRGFPTSESSRCNEKSFRWLSGVVQRDSRRSPSLSTIGRLIECVQKCPRESSRQLSDHILPKETNPACGCATVNQRCGSCTSLSRGKDAVDPESSTMSCLQSMPIATDGKLVKTRNMDRQLPPVSLDTSGRSPRGFH